MNKVTVTLEVAGSELVFEPNLAAYNSFLNEMQVNNKVAPAANYLRRIVSVDSKEALSEILEKHPGAAMQLAGTINEEFAPDLGITVKK